MRRPNPDITYYPDKYLNKPYKYIRTFADELIKELVANEDGVILPYNLGTLYIMGTKKLALNRKATIEKGSPVFYQNYETDGYRFQLVWNSTRIGHVKKARLNVRRNYKYALFIIKSYDKIKKAINSSIKNDKWSHWFRLE